MPNDTSNTYTIPSDSTWPVVLPSATEDSAGLMSAADKTKLDSIPIGGDSLLFNAPNPAVVVGSVVYESAADQIDLASASSTATVPAVGIVVSKPTPTTAYVNPAGEVSGYVGLVVGPYYVSPTTPGTFTATPPSTAGQVAQQVGYAKNATTLVVERGPIILL